MDVGLAGGDSLVVDVLAGGTLFEPAAEPGEVAEVAFADAVRVDQHATRAVCSRSWNCVGRENGKSTSSASHHVEQDQLVAGMAETGPGPRSTRRCRPENR